MQWVAIAQALINRPEVLLADESTGNLDQANRRLIMEISQKLNQERGLTMIMVTHDAEIARYVRRQVTLRDGILVSDEVRPEKPFFLKKWGPNQAARDGRPTIRRKEKNLAFLTFRPFSSSPFRLFDPFRMAQ